MADDLTCPTCMGIFNNPVLLSCGHSSCSDCLQRWWKEKRSQDCPVCRATCSSSRPPRNLALKNLCEAFLLEQERRADPGALREKLAALKLRLGCLRELRDGYDKVSEHAKAQARNAERHIKTTFRTLHRFLEEDEEARIADLRREEEQKSQKLRDLVERVSREMAALSEIVRTAEEVLADESAPWQKCESAVDKATQQQGVLADPGDDHLIDVAKHIGNLAHGVWVRMGKAVRFYPVVLDPNTAGNLLSLSEDLTAFKEGEDQRLPETGERLSFLSVLASEGFDSGRHSWDVHVGESKCWGVGVIEREAEGQRLKEMDSWRLVNGFFGLMTLGPGYVGEAVHVLEGREVTRVRLELDLANGQLAFTDLATCTLVHLVQHKFRGKVYPYFYNWDPHEIRIVPKKVVHSVAPW